MRPYTNAYQAPGGGFEFVPFHVRNGKQDGYSEKSESGTVPSAAYSHIVELDERIVPNGSLQISLGGSPATIVKWEHNPAAGEVAVNYDMGLLQFNAANEDNEIAVDYLPGGSPITAGKFNELQRAVVRALSNVLGEGWEIGEGGVLQNGSVFINPDGTITANTFDGIATNASNLLTEAASYDADATIGGNESRVTGDTATAGADVTLTLYGASANLGRLPVIIRNNSGSHDTIVTVAGMDALEGTGVVAGEYTITGANGVKMFAAIDSTTWVVF